MNCTSVMMLFLASTLEAAGWGCTALHNACTETCLYYFWFHYPWVMHFMLCTAAAPMLEGCSEKLRYFVPSLLLKEWLLLQRSNPESWRARKAAPATGFPFLYSSEATLVCKSLYSVCPCFAEMHRRHLSRSYSIALAFCFCEGSTMQLTSWEWPRAKHLLLNVTWASWQHLWRSRLWALFWESCLLRCQELSTDDSKC